MFIRPISELFQNFRNMLTIVFFFAFQPLELQLHYLETLLNMVKTVWNLTK